MDKWKEFFSYALFDWAISPASSVILTFIFPTYFVTTLAQADSCNLIGITSALGSENCGSLLWGYAATLSAVIIAIMAPILGKWADEEGDYRKWMMVLTLSIVVSSYSLWYATPGVYGIWLTLVAVSICTIAIDLCFIFYNALLPQIAKKENIGRLSGISWAAGYFGTITALVTILAIFILPSEPWFVGKENYAHVRVAGPVCAAWMLIFSLPYFLAIKNQSHKDERGKRSLRDLLITAWNIEGLIQYSIARMLIADALATAFAFGGILASTEHGFSSQEVLLFGLALNISAGIGGVILSFLSDTIQEYKLVIAYTSGLLLAGIYITFAPTRMDFWVAGMLLSFFIGPVQASTRTVYAKLCPENRRAELFGLFIFSGRATAFLGPALYTSFIYYSQSQRLGMLSVIILVAIALVLLITNKAMWRRESAPVNQCVQAQ